MDRIAKLQAHHAAILLAIDRGESAATIALAHGTDTQAVWRYLKRCGLKAKRPTHHRKIPLQAEMIQQLLDRGLTQAQVGMQLGVSLRTIEKRVVSMGLRTARTGPKLGHGHKFCWAGGRTVDKHGYVEVYVPLHPRARRNTGRVFEHRLVMELVLGRYLAPREVVHHVDAHPRHNWPENLRMYASNADHLRDELSHRPRGTLKSSIPGAYGNNQTIDHCPEILETLAPAPSRTRHALAQYIALHQPTSEQQSFAFREVLRLGPPRDPFRLGSTG